MVNELKNEGGGEIVSATVQKTIQSIKEIVGNYSDFEIYNALQDCNMEPNDTAQKLLNQDTFHVVRRRRDKKKENAGHDAQVEPKKYTQYGPGLKNSISDRNVHSHRRGSYIRSPAYDSGVNRQFRIVRDNRVNQNSDQDTKAATQVPSLTNAHSVNNVSERSSSVVPNNQRHWGGRYSQNVNGVRDFRPKEARVINSDTHNGHYEKKSALTSSETQVTAMKSNNSNFLGGGLFRWVSFQITKMSCSRGTRLLLKIKARIHYAATAKGSQTSFHETNLFLLLLRRWRGSVLRCILWRRVSWLWWISSLWRWVPCRWRVCIFWVTLILRRVTLRRRVVTHADCFMLFVLILL